MSIPFNGMAYPELERNTAVYSTYPKLVQHWKLVHMRTICSYTYRVCLKMFTRQFDANRHLRKCHKGLCITSMLPQSTILATHHANACAGTGNSSSYARGSLSRELGSDHSERPGKRCKENVRGRRVLRERFGNQGAGQDLPGADLHADQSYRGQVRLQRLNDVVIC